MATAAVDGSAGRSLGAKGVDYWIGLAGSTTAVNTGSAPRWAARATTSSRTRPVVELATIAQDAGVCTIAFPPRQRKRRPRMAIRRAAGASPARRGRSRADQLPISADTRKAPRQVSRRRTGDKTASVRRRRRDRCRPGRQRPPGTGGSLPRMLGHRARGQDATRHRHNPNYPSGEK